MNRTDNTAGVADSAGKKRHKLMADQGRWWKLWCSALSDPDLANLDIADFGRWAKLGAHLKLHGTGGTLRLAPPARTLVTAFQVENFNAVIACISRFPNCQIRRDDDGASHVTMPVTVTWTNWRKYQHDSSAERMRRKRIRDQRSDDIKRRGEEKRIRREKEENKKRETGDARKRGVHTDQEFIEILKANPAYKSLDIDRELDKIDAWLLTPRGRGKKKSRGRVVSWLNHALDDLPLPVQSGTSKLRRSEINEAWKDQQGGEVKL